MSEAASQAQPVTQAGLPGEATRIGVEVGVLRSSQETPVTGAERRRDTCPDVRSDRGRRPRKGIRLFDTAFQFLHGDGAFADALAQVRELGPADRTAAFDFNLIDAGRMDREDALDPFPIADATNGEGLVEAASAPADDDPRKHLNAFL